MPIFEMPTLVWEKYLFWIIHQTSTLTLQRKYSSTLIVVNYHSDPLQLPRSAVAVAGTVHSTMICSGASTKNQKILSKQIIYFAYWEGTLMPIWTNPLIFVKIYKLQSMEKYEMRKAISIENSLLPITLPLSKLFCQKVDINCRNICHNFCQAYGNPAPMPLPKSNNFHFVPLAWKE